METKGSEGVERRLSAILMADVVGYSRLMGDNEGETVRTLKAHRQVFADHISKARGRIVNAPGASIRGEFAAVVDAVGCAGEIQRALHERNTELPDDRRMLFRIGLNLGDVIVEEDAIYGDGVNVAARLEALAEPGGINISGKVHAEVENKLPLSFEFMGDQQVKNISKPVPTYRVLSDSAVATQRAVSPHRGEPNSAPRSLPARPPIAVLPFATMRWDPEQAPSPDGLPWAPRPHRSRHRAPSGQPPHRSPAKSISPRSGPASSPYSATA